MTPGLCSEPHCPRPVMARGLCKAHYERQRLRKIEAAGWAARRREDAADEPHTACPPGCVPLAAAVADLDARAIVRAMWPHVLEASIAGVGPFTLAPHNGATP